MISAWRVLLLLLLPPRFQAPYPSLSPPLTLTLTCSPLLSPSTLQFATLADTHSLNTLSDQITCLRKSHLRQLREGIQR